MNFNQWCMANKRWKHRNQGDGTVEAYLLLCFFQKAIAQNTQLFPPPHLLLLHLLPHLHGIHHLPMLGLDLCRVFGHREGKLYHMGVENIRERNQLVGVIERTATVPYRTTGCSVISSVLLLFFLSFSCCDFY